MAVSPKHSAAEEGPGGAAGSSQDGFHARFDTVSKQFDEPDRQHIRRCMLRHLMSRKSSTIAL